MKRYEIEQKYRVKNLEPFRKKLSSLRAKKVLGGDEYNELFDRRNELEKKKTVLRLRRHGKEAEILTLKGPLLKSKYSKRLELETRIEYKPMKAILKGLGYEKVFSYRKLRDVYLFEGVTVTLDRVTGLGSFIELEGSVQRISKCAKALGLTEKMREEKTYLKMLTDKKKKTKGRP